MRRFIFVGVLLVVSSLLYAQNSRTATASIAVTIIHPVGAGKIEKAPTGISQPGAITIIDLKKLGSFQIVNQGYVFDLYVSKEAMPHELKPRDVIVHFN